MHPRAQAQRQRQQRRAARRSARRQFWLNLSFLIHLAPFLLVVFLVTLVAGLRVGIIVALAWGIGLSVHGFVAVVAPTLRRFWIAQELHRVRPTPPPSPNQEIEGLLRAMGADPGIEVDRAAARAAVAELLRLEQGPAPRA